MDPTTLIILAVVAGLIFDLTNGWNDSANAIATVVSTRVMTPAQALLMSATLNVVGALVSVKVAKMMGSGIVDLPVNLGSVAIVLAAMIGAAGWVTWSNFGSMPSFVFCARILSRTFWLSCARRSNRTPMPGATANGRRAYRPISMVKVKHTSTVAVSAPLKVMPVPGVDRIEGFTTTM